mmetsp:Transcript_20623/g.44798  ORF Transcript_20623/g.44798 Transcript_20623/m.44798 type:complete len:322 (+) Transcript_20623:152-1117(+)|eukprot:CAMPEP_0172318608 /NCGR_PEP_ID=MMETSP1058-20130122/35365_1 /TAXON_ID=83371 /ORGANISM="Detonula confervacea, Strain CCMP 353" /LENGTH=321 /DNA_ID=CAMNT_0013033479 /DNA_START=92 /DNA_END=1057 /DNA_ORIENTATION=-
MNHLRPSILHRNRNMFSTVVNNLSVPNANGANFTWKYWRRANAKYPACWNQLRPHHVYTAELQNDECKDSGFSLRTCSLPSPLISSLPNTRNTSSMPLTLTLSEATHMKVSVRSMSSNITKSKVEFSTMGTTSHNTNASSKEEDKQKDKEDVEIASLPASQKARILFKKYGAVFVGTYLGIYVTTLFSFFVTLDFGLLDPETLSQIFKVSTNLACETADIIGPTGTGASMNEAANAYASEMTTEMTKDKRTMVDVITGYLQSWEWTREYIAKLSDNPHLANLALAWFVVKFTEPVRLAAAVIVTPKVASALGRKEAKTDAE